MKATPLALTATALLALAVGGCEHPQPTEATGQVVVPASPQATAAGEPSTDYSAPPYYVDRRSMREVLQASNPAVYSNTLLMSRPNLYEDPASYQAWVASHTMAGTTAPPAARSSVQREQRVFFDWDQATLTPAGADVVDALAKEARSEGAGRVAVVGKADRSGSDAHNMGLSQRRAEAVRDRLVAQGVPADQIDTRWVGERLPPVPTADGVREARNRVVDVTTTTMMAAAEAPKPAVALPRRVLFTTTEPDPPGSMGRELPGAVATGSVGGQAAGSP